MIIPNHIQTKMNLMTPNDDWNIVAKSGVVQPKCILQFQITAVADVANVRLANKTVGSHCLYTKMNDKKKWSSQCT